MESSFNIVDNKTFIYDGKSFEFENVKHFYAENTWEGGDYYTEYLFNGDKNAEIGLKYKLEKDNKL